MIVNLRKDDLVNLVMSQTPSYQEVLKYEKMGLGEFSASQYSEEWEWSQTALYRLGRKKLYNIYRNLTQPTKCTGVGMTRAIYHPINRRSKDGALH